MELKRVGVDLAKRVFQIHGVDASEHPVVRKTANRSQMRRFFTNLKPTLIGMEACGSAHYWARELSALGHQVKLIPPQFVKPYVKSNKNDANDAEAICEAVSRPTMRFVRVKTAEQQAMQSLHRIRSRIVRARTALVNEVRGTLAEFGLTIDTLGVPAVRKALPRIVEDGENGLPGIMRELLHSLYEELVALDERLRALTHHVEEHGKTDERVQRIQQLPGIGPITASAIVASVGDASQFPSGRDFAAWLGIVPKQHSSGGKDKLSGISKRGDSYLRTLLVHGARACVSHCDGKSDRRNQWISNMLKRRNKNITTVAVANKNARIVWALLTRSEDYRIAA
jgi:transposase